METVSGISLPDANPYVGPRTFNRNESHLFFGRESEARDLLSLVISEHIVLFYAQSGAGKSSLINARLIPGLEQKGFEVLPVGRISGALLREEPLKNIFVYHLELSLDQTKQAPERFRAMELADFLANLSSQGSIYIYDDSQAESSLVEPPAGGQVRTAPAGPEPDPGEVEIWPRALIIDQFEELFTTHPEAWEQRTDFFRQLAAAMEADPYLWVVLTMREDHVAAVDPYAYLLPGRLRTRYYMQRMGRQAALEAVTLPVAGRCPFTPGVADLLVDNLRLISVGETHGGAQEWVPGEFIEPVQLQVVCYQLWENLHGGAGTETAKPQITRDDLTRLSRGADLAQFVNQSLADFYEQAIARVVQAPGLAVSESGLREWFSTRLITEAETRGFVYQGEEKTAGLPNQAVTLLAAQHIIRSDSKAGGIWYELVHDRLIQPILQANRKWQAEHLNPITQAARAWQAAGKDPLKLYDGNQLKLAQASASQAELSNLEREFLDTSLKVSEKRRTLLQTLAIAGAALLFLVLGSLTVWAFTQQSKAIAAKSGLEQQVSNQQTIIPMYQKTISAYQVGAEQIGNQSTPTPVQLTLAATVIRPTLLIEKTLKPRDVQTATEAARQTATAQAQDTRLPPPLETLAPTPLPTPTLPFLRTIVIGQSAGGIDLQVTQLGYGPRNILLVGGLHAAFGSSTVDIARGLLDYFRRFPKEIPAEVTLHFLLNANPDSSSHPDTNGWLNGRKVSLHENWGCNWQANILDNKFTFSSGSGPFSEPEVIALRDYSLKILPAAAIFWAAKAPGWVIAGACKGPSVFSDGLAQVYAGAASSYHVHVYEDYAHGQATDWLDSQGIPSISVLMPDYENTDMDQHLKGVKAVIDWVQK